MATASFSTDLAKKRLQGIVDNAVRQTVDAEVSQKLDPRLTLIESRIAAIESRLDMTDRIAKLEAELELLKSSR